MRESSASLMSASIDTPLVVALRLRRRSVFLVNEPAVCTLMSADLDVISDGVLPAARITGLTGGMSCFNECFFCLINSCFVACLLWRFLDCFCLRMLKQRCNRSIYEVPLQQYGNGGRSGTQVLSGDHCTIADAGRETCRVGRGVETDATVDDP